MNEMLSHSCYILFFSFCVLQDQFCGAALFINAVIENAKVEGPLSKPLFMCLLKYELHLKYEIGLLSCML